MRRRIAALLALAIVAPAVRAQHTSPGWTYTMNVTFDSGDAHRGSTAMRYRTTADHLRTEIIQVSGRMIPGNAAGVDIEGMYNILNEKDSTYISVIPAQHYAMKMTNPMLLFGNSVKPTIAVQNGVTRTLEDLGAGERMLGHATHRYRSTTSGTMTTTVAGETCSYPVDGVTEMWVAPDMSIVPAMRSMVAHYGFELSDSAVAIGQARSPKGVALKSVSRSNVTLPSGERRVVTTTMEYTEISQAPIDDAVFEVPADYHVMDMRAMMADAMNAGVMDSIRNARPLRANCHR